MDNFSTFAIFIIESLALRWLIFDYKKLAFVRNFFFRGFLAELHFCVFCQGIEAGLVNYLSHFFGLNVDIIFWPLTVGFIALIFQAKINFEVESLENQLHFNFKEKNVE